MGVGMTPTRGTVERDMSKPVPRSRLHITYRTRIEGEPKKAKLPMRFLVLGKLTDRNDSLLGDRPMHSLLPGMKVDSFMQEMKVAAPIEPKHLQAKLTGHLDGTLEGVFKKKPESRDQTATVTLTGVATVEGKSKDNGLGDFKGEVTLTGEHDFAVENGRIKLPRGGEEIELHVVGKVEPPGDFEAGITGSVDVRIPIKVTQSTLADDDLVLDLKSPVEAPISVALTIPLRGISDFRPDHLAERVPEIRRLVLLRRLVLELRSYISSNPQLGVAIRSELQRTESELAHAKRNVNVDIAAADKELADARAALAGAQATRDAADEASKPKAQRELARAQDKLVEAQAKRAQAQRNEDLAAKLAELDGPKTELDTAKKAFAAAEKTLSSKTKARDDAQTARDAKQQAFDVKAAELDAAQKALDRLDDADPAKAAATTARDTAKTASETAATELASAETALTTAQSELEQADSGLDDAQDTIDVAKRDLAAKQAECDALARLSELTTMATLKVELKKQFPMLLVEPSVKSAAAGA
jgi:predicted component of type VI protein secretion system